MAPDGLERVMIRNLLCAVTFCGFAVASAPLWSGSPSKSAPQAGRTEISDVPYSEAKPVIGPKVVYGTDDRRDVYMEIDPTRLQQAASTCGLINQSRVNNNGNGTYSISTSAFVQLGLAPCFDEPFRTQPTAAFCTGFLVGPDLIATAGHCYTVSDITATRFVFNFQMANATTPVTTVGAEYVYQGIEIVGRALVGDIDYAVIRVDRAVTAPGATVQPIRRKGELQQNTNVGVIGHPSGLPKKIAFGSQTRATAVSDPVYFEANLDAYGGNSGSPVWNADTNQIEGILVRGNTDYVNNGGCFRSNLLPQFPGGEEVSRTSLFKNLVPGITMDRFSYSVGSSISVTVVEDNLVQPSFAILLTTSNGDYEWVTVADPDNDNVYTGSINMATPGATVTHVNQSVEVEDGDVITVAYDDSNAGGGVAMTFTDTATAHYTMPGATLHLVPGSGRLAAVISADHPFTAVVETGTACGTFTRTGASTVPATETTVTLAGLTPCITHHVRATLTDTDGNVYVLNGGNCTTGVPLDFGPTQLQTNFENGATGWTSSATQGSNQWAVRKSPHASSPTRVYSYQPATTSFNDSSLRAPAVTAPGILAFNVTYQLEDGYDGVVLEYSTNGGSTWVDAGSRIIGNGYDKVIASGYGSPIAGRPAWTGSTLGTMKPVEADFTNLATPLQIRWRYASDTSVSSTGYQIDDIHFYQGPTTCETSVTDWALWE